MTVQACNILEENIKYSFLRNQPIDFMTKLQSLNASNVELRHSDLGDNQATIYFFLDTARGQKPQQSR